MGGIGSGSWYRYNKKTTVEETRWLDASRWMRDGILVPDTHCWGGWAWTNSVTGQKTASIGYEVNTTTSHGTVRLFYTITPQGGEPQEYDYKVMLTTTCPNFGGVRWWFLCPLLRGERSCARRVGKLYLPPGTRYYGCRHCYDLSYESCNESDKRVSRLANLPVDALLASMGTDQENVTDLLLISRAIRKVEQRLGL